MAAFPFVAGLYTFKVPFFYFPKIRQIGWLKPFVVGLIWSGWVTAYPLIFGQIERADPRANFVLPSVWFWLQNFLFISILAIIFDIKDLRTDARFNLNTYPARLGIINTFRYVIYPLAIFTVIAFALFHIKAKLLLVQIFIQTIPYLLLTSVILTHRKPKNLLYYLVAIDGLMFLKAVCGSISILFF
jgi:4-hydroxybenzoate polyprenyltransferase